MSAQFQFDVFLAHHSGDKPFVREICASLKNRGLKPWLDEEQIAPGDSFQKAIQEAIPTVKTAAIILGQDGIGRWQNWEIQAFFAQCVKEGTKVIPVLLPGIDEVPETLSFLQQLRWINFSSSDDTKALGLLIWGITGQRPEEELQDSPATERSTQLVEPSSFDADTYFNQAQSEYELENYQAAIENCNRSIQLKPDFTEAYNHRGRARDALGDNEGAIEDYTQAIQLKPDFASPYNNRGNVYDTLGDKLGAIEDYTQAIQLKPDYADIYFNRGLTRFDLGDKLGAIEDYTQVIQLKPNDTDAYSNRGLAHSDLGDELGAIQDYQQAANLYLQQEKNSDYQNVLNQLSKLQGNDSTNIFKQLFG